jgi:PAS domain S-box-containing protein
MVRTPRYDETGAITGIAGIFWDVTEATRAEDALARERDLLSALMDSSLDFIYFKDLQSRFIRTNKAHATAFGLKDPAEVIGKADSDFFTGEHAQAAYDDEQNIIKTGKPLVGIEEKETWPDREDTWVSTTKHPLYDREGHIIGTFGITRDITERKRAAESLEKNLSAFLGFVSKASEGNLTLRSQEGKDTLGMVAQAINRMLDGFSAMLTEVKQLGLSLSSSATQILVAAEEISVGTQHQTNETSNVTSSVAEMAASMSQVSKNAEASAEAARRALDKADSGARSVRDTAEAMVKINSAVEQTADKMRTLAKRSMEITEIMGLITHAGDAGLGFSVVAEEIRKLADRSVQATRDVGTLIKGIHSETGEAISAMENGMKEVRAGLVLAEESRQSLQDIATVLKKSTELAEEISAASEEQTRVTVNLANAMQTISGITVEASAGAHQTTQIIQGMVGLSDKLNRSIGQFTVGDDSLISLGEG